MGSFPPPGGFHPGPGGPVPANFNQRFMPPPQPGGPVGNVPSFMVEI